MTKHHKQQAAKRVQARQGTDSIWYVISALALVVALFTALGWMSWSDIPAPVVETAPVSIEQTVESGGLIIHE